MVESRGKRAMLRITSIGVFRGERLSKNYLISAEVGPGTTDRRASENTISCKCGRWGRVKDVNRKDKQKNVYLSQQTQHHTYLAGP